MTDKTVFNYDALCLDDTGNIVHHDYWSPTYPTGCPFGITGHTLQTAFTKNSITEKSTIIKDDLSQTCGAYRAIGYTFDVGTGPNSSYENIGEISFPYNVRVLGITINPTTENINDYISIDTAKNTVIGALTTDVSSGNILNVSPTVFTYVCHGYQITIQNGTGMMDLGECIETDSDNGTLTVEKDVTSLLTAGSYVMMTMKRIENYRITMPGKISFGLRTLDSSLTPAGIKGSILYKNLSNTSKTFSMLIEIYY